jgi:hypothetical protein
VHRFASGRLPFEPDVIERDQQPAAEVVDQRNAFVACQIGQRARIDLGDKALHRKVAAMHLHDCAGAPIQC